MQLRTDRNRDYPPVSRLCMHAFFDVPLVSTAYALREFANVRLLGPFASVMNEDIVQGSMPCPSDVATMAAAPYNVGAVVNMCVEWPGPQAEYAKHGIVQCRLPHVDTCAPREAALREGAAFIAEFRAQNPGKRVFVHCKGGIARASTMTLAHAILNRGEDPHVAIKEMQRNRHVVMETVVEYESIASIVRSVASKR